jgi:hypothetical protein
VCCFSGGPEYPGASTLKVLGPALKCHGQNNHRRVRVAKSHASFPWVSRSLNSLSVLQSVRRVRCTSPFVSRELDTAVLMLPETPVTSKLSGKSWGHLGDTGESGRQDSGLQSSQTIPWCQVTWCISTFKQLPDLSTQVSGTPSCPSPGAKVTAA